MLGARKTAAGVLVVHDPDGRLSAAESDGLTQRLSRLYGLTPAEAVAAVMVTRRGGLAAVADELGVARSTVHTHVRRAFQKMSANSQVEVSRRVEALRLLAFRPST
jgi:DNA-binding CsgD family transcriptional regulator